MTERPLLITTQIATSNQTIPNPTTVTGDAILPMLDSAGDEEPYTIKCICEYKDDDGNTIYCEQCDTWQHTECYYPGRISEASRADFQHACVECKPRDLNFQDATARQRSNRENKIVNDNGDKKTKRPQSKSHKKKSKPADLQVNGFVDHDRHKNGSPQDHPQTKKTKGHRSNQSVGSQMKRSPPYIARPHPHAHPPSPAHTPPDFFNPFQVQAYSDKFLRLYDYDPPSATTNSFASLEVTNTMSLWLHDPEKLERDAGCKKDDVFQRLKVAYDELLWRELRPVQKFTTIDDTTIRWRFLTSPAVLEPVSRIAELNGLVGFQRDYCQDVDSRWNDAPHPQPFVFFHPRLPLYIDTRHEGSTCRYVRRSCRANTFLDTFLAGGGSEYHFWLISERQISPGEQLTIPWDFRFPSNEKPRYLHLLNLSNDDSVHFDNAEATDEEYEQLSQLIQLVLSDHGGCACELQNDCAFSRFHRNYHARSQPQSNGVVKSKKGRKPKQNHISPTSTGHATNSRAPSEGQGDAYDEDENRSASGSIRSKPHSRDLTPAHGTNETNGILTEPTDREKRKLAALEDSFRKLEQGQPPRKKKRASDGSNVTAPTNPASQSSAKPRQKSVARMSVSQSSAHTTNGQRARQYADASTSRRQSDSPFSAVSPTGVAQSPNNAASRNGSMQNRSRQVSATSKPTYVDSTTQTEEVEKAWWNLPPSKVKRAIVPLGKRLLRNRRRIQEQQDLHQVQAQAFLSSGSQFGQSSPTIPMDLDNQTQEVQAIDSPTEIKGRNASISSSTHSVDIAAPPDSIMTDVPAVTISNQIKPPPPPWPSQTATVPVHTPTSPMQRSPDLHLQLPPTPGLSSTGFSGPPSALATPSSSSGTLVQSPFGTFSTPGFNGSLQHASPVKTTKKLSLSDYKAARMKKSDTSNASKPSGGSPIETPTVLKPSLSTIEEAKVQGIVEESAIAESPDVEKALNPLAVVIPEAVPRE